ncbi:hypothetical protein KR032_011592, partial [Drosophila birchii]
RSQRRNKKKKVKEVVPKVSFTQLMKLNAPEWRLMLVGSIASVMHGSTFPL